MSITYKECKHKMLWANQGAWGCDMPAEKINLDACGNQCPYYEEVSYGGIVTTATSIDSTPKASKHSPYTKKKRKRK